MRCTWKCSRRLVSLVLSYSLSVPLSLKIFLYLSHCWRPAVFSRRNDWNNRWHLVLTIRILPSSIFFAIWYLHSGLYVPFCTPPHQKPLKLTTFQTLTPLWNLMPSPVLAMPYWYPQTYLQQSQTWVQLSPLHFNRNSFVSTFVLLHHIRLLVAHLGSHDSASFFDFLHCTQCSDIVSESTRQSSKEKS